MQDDIKIILTSHCGTYDSWLQWTVASVYNVVDHVVVVNSGYIPENPEKGNCNILEREKNQIKEIDVDNKILQIKANNEKLKNTGLYTDGKDELARSGNMTLAYQYALQLAKDKEYDLSKVWILKLDSDQIADETFTRNNLVELAKSGKAVGYRFGQYSDFFRTYDKVQSLCHWCAGEEGNMTNDGALFFKAHSKARAGGQGSPEIGEEYPHSYMKTFHMRRISPPDVNERDYHFKRVWYHTWGPNQINECGFNREHGRSMTNNEIWEEAEKLTEGIMSSEGHSIEYFNNDPRFPSYIPAVIKTTPIKYIKKGLPV